jgi:oxalate decarboxylase
MLFHRRDFLRSALAAATISAVPTVQAKAEKKTDNTHPEPSFNNTKADVFPGGTIKSLTVAETPSIPNMSTSLVEMKPGGLRGMHWHKTASEIGYVVSGDCILTVYDPNNHMESGPLNAGDIWFVPRGFSHSLWAAGNQGCTFCTVYDDGVTTEQNALHVTDLLRSGRPEITYSSLGIPAERILSASANLPILSAGRTDPGSLSPHGFAGPAPESFRFKLTQLPAIKMPGGTFVQASKSDFPMSLTMVGAITILDPDGIREPHWHPNADEWDLVLEGRALITIFDGSGPLKTVELGPNDIGFLPRNEAHAVETTGGKTFKLLSVFNANAFESIGISELLAGTPDSLIAQNFGLSPEKVAMLPKQERFIVRKASPPLQ